VIGPLRIVHAVRSDAFAGVERYVAVLAEAQVRQGHDVRIIGGDPAAVRAAVITDAVLHREATTVLQTARAIDASRTCDILHVHMTAAEFAAFLAVRSRHVPVVSTRHFGARRGRNPVSRLGGKAVARRIDAQIAVSRFVAERIEGASTVVYPGLPAGEGIPDATRRGRSVLVTQRLQPEKHTAVALRAFAASGLVDAGWRLDIAGVGSELPALERLADRLDIAPAVHFLGFRTDVPELMRRAGILLASCPAEHFGLTVLEAMGAGLPVVAAAAGGHLETVGAAPGAALFAPDDAADAAGLLAALAGDDRRRESYGAALHGIQCSRFTVEAQATATEDVYRGVL